MGLTFATLTLLVGSLALLAETLENTLAKCLLPTHC